MTLGGFSLQKLLLTHIRLYVLEDATGALVHDLLATI
jgi:hypothetical protein